MFIWKLASATARSTLILMKVEDVKRFAERQPFRPFAVRLNNGAQYTFAQPRSFGAPGDYHAIFFFGEADWTMIDTDSIVEVLEQG
jgi:hypothetical protein